MHPRSVDWQLACVSLLTLTVVWAVMKAIAAARAPRPAIGWRSFVFSPVLSPTSFDHSRPLSQLPRVAGGTVLLLASLVACYWLWWRFVPGTHVSGATLGYMAVIPLMFLTQSIAELLTLAWVPSGRLLPSFHRNPPAASSVGEFWSARWNLWFSDWFRLVILKPLRRRSSLAVLLVFFVSGLLHEITINVPFYCLTGRWLIGSMLIYYMLQAVGILLERRLPRKASRLRVLFVWLFVFAPAPLMMNEAMLRIMHLWP